jgi:hypothetical protein
MSKHTGWVLGLGAIGVLAIGGVLARDYFAASPSLTEADRAAAFIDETVDGHHRLRHPTLGFAFDSPGPAFAPSKQLAETMAASDPDHHMQVHAWADSPVTAVIAVTLLNVEVPDREAMAKELAKMEHGVRDGAGSASFDDGVVWTDSLHEAHFYTTLQNRAHVHMRMIPLVSKHGAVAMMVISKDPTAQLSTLASLATVN